MTNTDTSTDSLHGLSPTDIIIIGSGGQTLADAAVAERATITIPTSIDGRPAHPSVPGMISAVCRAAVQLAPHPFVVQYDEGEWIIAVTDADDSEGCIYTDNAARTDAAVRMVHRLLPTWARQSTHEHQTRAIGPITYARQRADNYSALHHHTLWGVEMDASIIESLSLRWHIEITASSHDEVAQVLWQHLGCPRNCGLMIVPASGEAIWYDVEDWTIALGAPYWEPVHAFPALTRADSHRDLPDATDEVVREIHRARTTGARHASRVRSARASMIQYVIDECFGAATALVDDTANWVRHGGDDPAQVASWHVGIPRARGIDQPYTAEEGMRILAALAAMELHGVGGPGGMDGGATTTMSWRAGDPTHGRRGLGKGRRQASDGQAWDAAIRDAALGCESVTPADVLLALPVVRSHDLEWPMALALSRAYDTRHDAETSRAWCDVARAVMTRAQEPGAPLDGPVVRLGQRYGVGVVS